jgi:hypothetical protein
LWIRNERQEEKTARECKRMGPAIEIVSAWLFGLMVFFTNPLNDATDPASRMNYHHSGNMRIREAVRTSYGKDIHVEWLEIMPYVYSGVVSFLGWMMMRMASFVLAGYIRVCKMTLGRHLHLRTEKPTVEATILLGMACLSHRGKEKEGSV